MKYIIALFLLLAADPVRASWSDFAHVTPETQDKYKIDVNFSPVANRENIYRVNFNAVGSKHKQAWLIIAAAPLSREEQKLRGYIWRSRPPKTEIFLKTLIKPVESKPTSSEEKPSPNYEVELSSEMIKRSYIYIDFPFMVADGGYYYSIDLGTYLAEYEKHTNQ